MASFCKRVALGWGPPGKTHCCCLNSVYPVHTEWPPSLRSVCRSACEPTHGLGFALRAAKASSRGRNWDLPGTQHACKTLQEQGKTISLNSAACFCTALQQTVFPSHSMRFFQNWETRRGPTMAQLTSVHSMACSAVLYNGKKCLLQIELQQCIWIQA